MGSRQHNIRQKTPKYPVTHIYAGYTPPPSSVVRAMLFAYKQMDHGDNFVHLHYVPFLSFAWTINGNVNRVQSFRRAAVQQKIYKLTPPPTAAHRTLFEWFRFGVQKWFLWIFPYFLLCLTVCWVGGPFDHVSFGLFFMPHSTLLRWHWSGPENKRVLQVVAENAFPTVW